MTTPRKRGRPTGSGPNPNAGRHRSVAKLRVGQFVLVGSPEDEFPDVAIPAVVSHIDDDRIVLCGKDDKDRLFVLFEILFPPKPA